MIHAQSPNEMAPQTACAGCAGDKGAPIAVDVVLNDGHGGFLDREQHVKAFELCHECARDLANAVGFFCVKDGGWSKLEPKNRKAKR